MKIRHRFLMCYCALYLIVVAFASSDNAKDIQTTSDRPLKAKPEEPQHRSASGLESKA